MKSVWVNKIVKIVFSGVIMALLVFGGLWLFKYKTSGDELINIKELSSEFMDNYFGAYAEMVQKNNPENILIVMSYNPPKKYGAIDIVEGPNHTYYLMYDSNEQRDIAYENLKNDDNISVEKNSKMELVGYNSWGIETMGLDDGLEAIAGGGERTKVAVIDTGLDVANFRKYYPNRTLSVYNVEASSSSISDMIDTHSHGTHVAGTVAEGTPSNVEIMAIRASSGEDNTLYISDVNTSINKAIYASAGVINLSLGNDEYSESQKTILDSAYRYNIVVVAATGNENSPQVMYPARYDNTIAVGALDQDLNRAVWSVADSLGSNYGDEVDYVAPGTAIKGINGYKSGTSMATPHVAAAVAILKSYNRDLGLNEVNGLLQEHVRDLGEEGRDTYYGYGMIDFNGAEFCGDGYCDEYGVFSAEAPVYAKIEIDEVTLTELNYYSIQNLMLTEAKLYTDDTSYKTAKLQEIEGLEISGYDAESFSEQEVTVSYGGISTHFKVTNPEDYQSGWEYSINENNEILLNKYTDIRDLDWDNGIITKIYIPSVIDGKNVVALDGYEKTYTYGVNDEYTYTYKVSAFGSYASNQTEGVYLPETLTRIGEDSFENFSQLKKVVMLADAVEVEEGAFARAYRLKTVNGNISKLGASAFIDDRALKAISLAEGVTEIPNYAFSGCTSLEEVSIPSTVTVIDYNAFYGDSALKAVGFSGDNLVKIEYNAFSGVTKLSGITFPESLEEIGYNAFSNSGLTSVYIPAGVNSIGDGVFDGCGNLETIAVADGNQKYYDIDDAVLMRRDYSIGLVRGTKKLIIPDNTQQIGLGAFSGLTTIKKVVIPDSVTNIGYMAFGGCTGLEEATIPKNAYLGTGSAIFTNGRDENLNDINLDVKLKVYSGSSGYEYATYNKFAYETLDASYAKVVNKTYEYGDTLDDSDEIEIYYDYGVIENGELIEYTDTNGTKTTMTVNELSSVAYSGDVDYFRIGDTYFVGGYKDLLNKDATIRINITVNGEVPEYTIPTGLTGKLRKNLDSVELPDGFSWMSNDYLWELGEHTYLATYTPENPEMYAPIENIEIVVDVIVGRTKLSDPEIVLESKVYDGSWSIDEKYLTVNIEGLSADDYYVSASTSSISGTTTAYIYIYLTNEVADNYGFGDNYDSFYSCHIDNYVILEEEWPSLELVSVSQYGEEIEPVWDEYLYNEETWDFGAYYYPVANNSDKVTVGVKVNGLEDGVEYGGLIDGQTITSESNGQVIYVEKSPSVWMGDSYSCEEDELGQESCSGSYGNNEYHVDMYLLKNNSWDNYVEKRIVVRPAVVGSSDIEIMSVKQDGVDVTLDTVGRQVKDVNAPQTINEYQLLDYTKPVTIEYKVKNLREGWQYSVSAGSGESESFVADATGEKTGSKEVYVDALDKHAHVTVSLWGYEENTRSGAGGQWHNSSAVLYFRVADEDFVSLGNFVVDKVEQNGVQLEPTVTVENYWQNYTFDVNDIQDIEVTLHATKATDTATYYVGNNIGSERSYSYRGTEWTAVSGAELKEGITITVPAEYNGEENSPYTLYVYVKMIEDSNSYSSKNIYYGQYDLNNYNGDRIKLNFYENEEIPRYDVDLGYTNYEEMIDTGYGGGVVNARYHNADNPLMVRIGGAHYIDDQIYDVRTWVFVGEEEYYSRTFAVVGSELNNGKEIVLEGLTLSLPEYVYNGGIVEADYYDFVIEIDGMRKECGIAYSYDGFVDAVVTYAGGRVIPRSFGGVGGESYMTMRHKGISRDVFDEDVATLYYVGSGFDDDVQYEYELYYNGDVNGGLGEEEVVGEKIAEGTISGKDLNDGKLKTVMVAPDADSDGARYDLVIRKDGGLVRVIWDQFAFWDGAGVTSVAVDVDGDYIQTSDSSYRVVKGSDVAITLMGTGFEDDKLYNLNITHNGGYNNDLAIMNRIIEVMGAELNNGEVTYVVEYGNALGEAEYMYLNFTIVDNEGNEYPGHGMDLQYAEPDDVYNMDEYGGGFVIDSETGEIRRIPQGEPQIEVDNRANGVADVEVLDDGIAVIAEKACVVIISYDGGETYERVPAVAVEGQDNKYKFTMNLTSGIEIHVALKGDISGRGRVTVTDALNVAKSLKSGGTPLTGMAAIIADVNGDGRVTVTDALRIAKSKMTTPVELNW